MQEWLSLQWDKPERSYNPNLRDFLSELLGYPVKNVITEDRALGGGYPDLQLQGPDGAVWVVGDLKLEDAKLTSRASRRVLWEEKKKYVSGLVRYALFLTPHFLWITEANGNPVEGFAEPLDLRSTRFDTLQKRLEFVSYALASHEQQWKQFVAGQFPYSYLDLMLGGEDAVGRLRRDLQEGFKELSEAADVAIANLRKEHAKYRRKLKVIEEQLQGQGEAQRRAKVRLELEYQFVRRLFDENFPQFQEQYGREVEAKGTGEEERVLEAFVADSVAALAARVLLLRLLEDLGLTGKRRLTNGGPKRWSEFVEFLTGSATALVRVASEDLSRLYQEFFAEGVFDWIQRTNGELDQALQRLILRLNAYDFRGLSEEILGDIYQQFLPPAKRKRLGEFYTPPGMVDWLLEQSVFKTDDGDVLDPSCGSGSFLVRLLHHLLEDAEKRGLEREPVRQEIQRRLWGFDLNPFASFISLFQLMWGLLRFLPKGDPPNIHVYNLNSRLSDSDIAKHIGEESLVPGSKERDGKKWRYIVGNPPYIRAERVKYGQEMQKHLKAIWGQNADTGLAFLYRALTEWLEDGGTLAMVVSGGYASSEAAAKVWKLLHPGGKAALRKLVWLEFAGKQWDANVIPMLLVIEKIAAKDDDEIELLVPQSWPDKIETSKVKYSDFFDPKVNPKVTPNGLMMGEYLLPMLRGEDVPVIRKLAPGNGIGTLKDSVLERRNLQNQLSWWTYGIQRGGAVTTEAPLGKRPVRLFGGSDISVGWVGEGEGWVDLEAVKERPYGKLSLWTSSSPPKKFLAVAEIALMPFAALIEGDSAANNSVPIAAPHARIAPESVAAYINSSLLRYYWAVKERSGVLEGSSRAHIYPRTLEALPWPKNLSPELEKSLADGYKRLAELAKVAKNNPNEWLLSELERQVADAANRVVLKSRELGLQFGDWQTDPTPDDLELDGTRIIGGLFASFELGDPDLAELVYNILKLTAGDEPPPISKGIIQSLVVPKEYAKLIAEFRQRHAAFQAVERDFMKVLGEIDEAVYEAFGLSAEERAYVEGRLASFPLNRLKPRYPWQTVKLRPVKAYLEDRFR